MTTPSRGDRVRASDAGAGDQSDEVIGARLLGELTYVWERSAGDSPSDYSVLPGCEPSYNDETAPADGSTRWYQATIVTEDGRGFAASADEGNLSAGLPGVRTEESVYTSGSSAILRGALESLGEPSATDYGFCIGTNPNPTLDAGSDATCVSLGTPAGTGDFSTTVTDLELGRQFVRAFAVNAAGEAYGGSCAAHDAAGARRRRRVGRRGGGRGGHRVGRGRGRNQLCDPP